MMSLMHMMRGSPILAFCLLCVLAFSSQARGPWRASEDNTRGWQFMAPEERIEHQAKIRGFTDHAQCKAYQAEHHRRIEARARELGRPLPEGGRDFCEHLRGRGSGQ